jgi:hypothetical protein
MKYILILSLMLAWAGTVRSEDTASAPELSGLTVAALQLVEAMNYCDMLEGSLKEMKQAQIKQISQMTGRATPAAEREVNRTFELIAETMDCASMKLETARVYAELFTEEELRGLVEFYRSELGQSLNRKQPEIMKRSMQISMERMNKAMPMIMQKMQQERRMEAAEGGQVPAKQP